MVNYDEWTWVDNVPDDCPDYDTRIAYANDGTPWIVLYCPACQKNTYAATHLEIWDWIFKGWMHYKEHHERSLPR